MSNLRTCVFPGDGTGFAGVFGTNRTKSSAEQNPQTMALFNATSPADTNETTFTVTSGTGVLYGGIGDWQNGGEVGNAAMWVKSPSGAMIDTATTPDAAGQVVILPKETQPAGSVMAFIIIDPEPGVWTVNVTDESDAQTFEIAVSTVSSNGIADMISSFESISMINPETPAPETADGLAAAAGSSWSWGCFACKCVTYPVALAIVGIGWGAMSTLTATSAIIVAMTAWAAWITAPIAIAFLVGLGATIVAAVDFVLVRLCDWVGACES
jgi:hypothetical protein